MIVARAVFLGTTAIGPALGITSAVVILAIVFGAGFPLIAWRAIGALASVLTWPGGLRASRGRWRRGNGLSWLYLILRRCGNPPHNAVDHIIDRSGAIGAVFDLFITSHQGDQLIDQPVMLWFASRFTRIVSPVPPEGVQPADHRLIFAPLFAFQLQYLD
jgi:hypothetical protein